MCSEKTSFAPMITYLMTMWAMYTLHGCRGPSSSLLDVKPALHLPCRVMQEGIPLSPSAGMTQSSDTDSASGLIWTSTSAPVSIHLGHNSLQGFTFTSVHFYRNCPSRILGRVGIPGAGMKAIPVFFSTMILIDFQSVLPS